MWKIRFLTERVIGLHRFGNFDTKYQVIGYLLDAGWKIHASNLNVIEHPVYPGVYAEAEEVPTNHSLSDLDHFAKLHFEYTNPTKKK